MCFEQDVEVGLWPSNFLVVVPANTEQWPKQDESSGNIAPQLAESWLRPLDNWWNVGQHKISVMIQLMGVNICLWFTVSECRWWPSDAEEDRKWTHTLRFVCQILVGPLPQNSFTLSLTPFLSSLHQTQVKCFKEESVTTVQPHVGPHSLKNASYCVHKVSVYACVFQQFCSDHLLYISKSE